MALSNTRLRDALYDAFLSLPARHPSTNEEVTFGDLMSDEQKNQMRNHVNIIAVEIVKEIKDNAVSKIALSTHTHLGVVPGGGISGAPVVDGVTNVETGVVE